MRQLLKSFLFRLGYRVVNSRRRWGIDLVDDLYKLQPPCAWKTIFDVGANRGQTASRFSKAFPKAKIYSFEPFADTFRELSSTALKIGRNQVIPCNFALSDNNGAAQFRVFDDGAKNTLIPNLADSMRGEAKLTSVQTRTVDAFCDEGNIENIDLLKIDVEGAEVQVIDGAVEMLSKRKVKYVYAEFHRFSATQASGSGTTGHTAFEKLLTTMKPHRMRPLSIYTDSVHLDEPIGTYNVLFGPT